MKQYLDITLLAERLRIRKPAEFSENPSQQKTAEGLSPESRASVPGYPLRSGDSKRGPNSSQKGLFTMFNRPAVVGPIKVRHF